MRSHVIEHIANPIHAVEEWKRVLRTGGVLIVVAPRYRHTFDRRRPLTSIAHRGRCGGD